MFTAAKIRIIAWAVIVMMLVFACRQVYKAGYNAATAEQDRLIQEAKDEARAAEQAFWKEAVERAEANIRTEEVIVERIKEVEKKIPIVVDRIVEIQPECAELPADFVGLLNDQIRAGREPDNP